MQQFSINQQTFNLYTFEGNSKSAKDVEQAIVLKNTLAPLLDFESTKFFYIPKENTNKALNAIKASIAPISVTIDEKEYIFSLSLKTFGIIHFPIQNASHDIFISFHSTNPIETFDDFPSDELNMYGDDNFDINLDDEQKNLESVSNAIQHINNQLQDLSTIYIPCEELLLQELAFTFFFNNHNDLFTEFSQKNELNSKDPELLEIFEMVNDIFKSSYHDINTQELENFLLIYYSIMPLSLEDLTLDELKISNVFNHIVSHLAAKKNHISNT